MLLPILLRTLRRPMTLYAALALWCAALLFIVFASPNFRGTLADGASIPGGDYLQFFVAAKMVTGGVADQLYDFTLQQSIQRDPALVPYTWDPRSYLLFVYPPFVAAFFVPWSLFPFMTSAILWLLTMAASGAVSLWCLVREYSRLRPYFGGVLIAALIYRPFVHAIYSCQNSTLSLLLFTGTFLLLRRERFYTAGCVAALLSFKPQLLIVVGIAAILARAWRFVAGLISVGSLLGVCCLLVSVDATVAYLTRLPELSRWIEMPGMSLAGMSCWYGFFRLVLDGASLGAIQLCTVLASAVTIGLVVARVRRFPLADEVSWSMVVIGTLLVSPHLLAYDLTLLLLPCALLVGSERLAHDLRGRWIAAALYLGAIVSPGLAKMVSWQPIVIVMFVALLLLRRAA